MSYTSSISSEVLVAFWWWPSSVETCKSIILQKNNSIWWNSFLIVFRCHTLQWLYIIISWYILHALLIKNKSRSTPWPEWWWWCKLSPGKPWFGIPSPTILDFRLQVLISPTTLFGRGGSESDSSPMLMSSWLDSSRGRLRFSYKHY